MTKKEKLYYLIEHYMLGEYDTQTYADEFSGIYWIEDEDDSVSEIEEHLFREIGEIASRVSCFKSDLTSSPGVYFTEIDIRRKTIEVCQKLNIKY